jgi:hypothetical protein
MADFRTDVAFQAMLKGAEATIESLAGDRVPDAVALMQRAAGKNNLQGHYNALLPLAVLIARTDPSLLSHVKSRTSLLHNMGAGSSEARSATIWKPVEADSQTIIRTRSSDVLTVMLSGGLCRVRDAATYLSPTFGGAQVRGGGGNTVLKRTIKLLAHTWPC